MKPNKPYTAITDRIIFDTALSPTDKLVYITICQPAYGKKEVSFPSQERIAFLCNIDPKTVQRSIATLILHEYLAKHRTGKQMNNTYILNRFPTKDVEKQKTETEKLWVIRSEEMKANAETNLKNQKSDTPPMSSHSNPPELSDTTLQKSDTTFKESDTTNEGGSDTTLQPLEAVQYKAEQKLEASQNLEADSAAPLRSAASSKNDEVSQGTNSAENINPKETTKDSASKSIGFSNEKFDKLFTLPDKSQFSSQVSSGNAQVSSGFDMQEFTEVPALAQLPKKAKINKTSLSSEDFIVEYVSDALRQNGVSENVIEVLQSLGVNDFHSEHPQLSKILMQAYTEAKNEYAN